MFNLYSVTSELLTSQPTKWITEPFSFLPEEFSYFELVVDNTCQIEPMEKKRGKFCFTMMFYTTCESSMDDVKRSLEQMTDGLSTVKDITNVLTQNDQILQRQINNIHETMDSLFTQQNVKLNSLKDSVLNLEGSVEASFRALDDVLDNMVQIYLWNLEHLTNYMNFESSNNKIIFSELSYNSPNIDSLKFNKSEVIQFYNAEIKPILSKSSYSYLYQSICDSLDTSYTDCIFTGWVPTVQKYTECGFKISYKIPIFRGNLFPVYSMKLISYPLYKKLSDIYFRMSFSQINSYLFVNQENLSSNLLYSNYWDISHESNLKCFDFESQRRYPRICSRNYQVTSFPLGYKSRSELPLTFDYLLSSNNCTVYPDYIQCFHDLTAKTYDLNCLPPIVRNIGSCIVSVDLIIGAVYDIITNGNRLRMNMNNNNIIISLALDQTLVTYLYCSDGLLTKFSSFYCGIDSINIDNVRSNLFSTISVESLGNDFKFQSNITSYFLQQSKSFELLSNWNDTTSIILDNLRSTISNDNELINDNLNELSNLNLKLSAQIEEIRKSVSEIKIPCNSFSCFMLDVLKGLGIGLLILLVIFTIGFGIYMWVKKKSLSSLFPSKKLASSALLYNVDNLSKSKSDVGFLENSIKDISFKRDIHKVDFNPSESQIISCGYYNYTLQTISYSYDYNDITFSLIDSDLLLKVYNNLGYPLLCSWICTNKPYFALFVLNKDNEYTILYKRTATANTEIISHDKFNHIGITKFSYINNLSSTMLVDTLSYSVPWVYLKDLKISVSEDPLYEISYSKDNIGNSPLY